MQKDKLLKYSIGCVAFLVAAQELEAQVVYTDIDPDLLVGTDYDYSDLDIDMDGLSEFSFLNTSWCCYCGYSCISNYSFVFAVGNDGGEFINHFDPDYGDLIDPISFGEEISAEDSFGFSGYLHSWSNYVDYETSFLYAYSPFWGWGGGSYGYISDYFGIRFPIDGDYHYGWIKVGEPYSFDSFGYNTVAGMPILAGEGSCENPDVTDIATTPTGLKFFFEDGFGTNKYRVRYREAGAGGPFTKVSSSLPHITIDGLDCSTTYEYQLMLFCAMDSTVISSSWGAINTATTADCRIGQGVEASSLVIFPNPAADYFHLNTVDEYPDGQLKIIGEDGRLVKMFTNLEAQYFDISDLPEGVYWLRVESHNQESSHMLVVQRK